MIDFYYTALDFAAISGNLDMFKYLISTGKFEIPSKNVF